MASRMDFSNKKVGNAFIVKSIHVANKKKLFWLCKCDCGNEFLSTSYQLSHNKTIACIDCINKERAEVKKKHGMHGTRIYHIWEGMHNRCSSKRNDLKDIYYRQKGITVCEEWNDFSVFYKWAIEEGYNDNLTIDRIDVTKGYCPGNCHWVTMKEQSRNKNNSLMITIDGVKRNLAEWCEIYNISYQLARQRITRGIEPIKALTEPSRKIGEKI